MEKQHHSTYIIGVVAILAILIITLIVTGTSWIPQIGTDRIGGALAPIDGGEVQRAVDTTKPYVWLISPLNGASIIKEPLTLFQCSGYDYYGLKKVDLWLAEPGKAFYIAQSAAISGTSVTQQFYRSFNATGNYAWNCRFTDTSNNYAYGNTSLGKSPGFTITDNVINTCTDSDGYSTNPQFIAGYVSGYNNSIWYNYSDYCSSYNSKVVNEYSCDNTYNTTRLTPITCPGICSGGRCI